jgi:hypothetical protein
VGYWRFSLVTSALTYMSQNGITVGDIFNKITGQFDALQVLYPKVGGINKQQQISNHKA